MLVLAIISSVILSVEESIYLEKNQFLFLLPLAHNKGASGYRVGSLDIF